MPRRRSISRTAMPLAYTASRSTCRSWRRSLSDMAAGGTLRRGGGGRQGMMALSVGRASMGKTWKKGRGKLGFLQPLLGRWTAESKSGEMGPVRCTRSFEPVLGGSYVRLDARWELGGGDKVYEEHALIGSGDEGKVCFWSFTSD